MSRPAAPRRQRADATLNRARIVAAARTLFAERGSAVQLPEIARVAGVGIGTVYRHFPTHADLIEAAAEQRFAEIEDFARNECVLHAEPGQALARYLNHVGEVLTADRGLSAAIEAARESTGSEPRGETRARLETVIAELIERDRPRAHSAMTARWPMSTCSSARYRRRSATVAATGGDSSGSCSTVCTRGAQRVPLHE